MEPTQDQETKTPPASKKSGVSKNAIVFSGAIVLAAIIISGAVLSNDSDPREDSRADSQDRPALVPKPEEIRDSGDSVTVSVDDDPVLGDPAAPVTVIEFSDYECPFCKRAFEELLPELKKAYIDTGKVRLVYRDLPLPFIHPNAQKKAEAAECAGEQGGDDMYFKFHDQIFTQTQENGRGLSLTQLPVIAASLGLDTNQFKQCLDSGKFSGEVEKDMADAAAVGIGGTPSYVVGKSSADGTINGTIIRGAQPFKVFQALIDEELRK